jgi:hypothetical protein
VAYLAGKSKLMPKRLASTGRSKSPLALTVVLALTILPFAGSGRSEPIMIWAENNNGGLTTLAYGSLSQAEAPLFMLSCFSGLNIVVLDVHKEVPGGKPGDPLTIELSSAKAQAPVKAEVGKDDATGTTFGEASDIDVKPVLAVLGDPGPLTVKMGGASATMTDLGRAEAVAKFVENCKLQ